MPHAFYRNYQHIVFSTKDRRKFLRSSIRTTVLDSIRTTCRDYTVTIIEINGTENHLHLLVNIPPKHAVSNIVRAIKGNSSKLLNEAGHLFAWQEGYGAFSVSESGLVAVRRYICEQERHHQTRTFDEEFVALLGKHGIALDRPIENERMPSGRDAGEAPAPTAEAVD